jgi:predicted nucleotidyltransferase
MLRESNCFIFEWLTSDIKYKQHEEFVEEALQLGMSTISWKAIAFHYLNKAKKHMRGKSESRLPLQFQNILKGIDGKKK